MSCTSVASTYLDVLGRRLRHGGAPQHALQIVLALRRAGLRAQNKKQRPKDGPARAVAGWWATVSRTNATHSFATLERKSHRTASRALRRRMTPERTRPFLYRTSRNLAFRFTLTKTESFFSRVYVVFSSYSSWTSGLWTYQPGLHRRKVTQDFSSTFLLRCLP